ncbi:DNA polymerase III subunit gamma/tau [Pleurocapsa sp. PCC 7319]|uniref:DNA polymerase III subunit gamma/tau n=1 Tax=Pleurocapsa sp. PCC 7319 TaxID=118161 RepID=UPI0003483C49|nr:DNA polymerase III subunit gamma/tau [Pleurocapsa sp. PCC 7319]
MPYEPLHHKYRPQTFKDLVGQQTIALTLSNALKQEKIAPAYLFTGPRGTGKTSSARILAKSLNCLAISQPTPEPCGQCEACKAISNGTALDVMEIDAASNTGVDNIREIIERSRFAPVQCRYKIYVIDECHMLSTAAFNALLKTLEEPPPRVVFILATTDPQRVLSTIISRCQRFDYRRIPLAEMIAHLQYIAEAENIAIADEAITLIAQIANGGLRDAESLLDQLSLLPEKISVAKVWDLIGAVPEQDLLNLIREIRNNLPIKILQQCRNLLDRGREPLVVLQNLASFYLNLLIAKTAPQHTDLVAVTETCWQELCIEATNWDTALILRGQQHLKEAETQLKHTTQPRLWLEVTLLGLLSGNNLPVVTAQSQIVVKQPVADAPKPAKPNHTNNNGAKAQLLNGASGQNHVPLANTTPSPASPLQTTSIPVKVVNQQELTSERSAIDQRNQTTTKVPINDLVNSSQSSEPVIEPELKKTPPSYAPIVNENISNQELWNKIVSCLHPPTTQALLKQQCHLVTFDGSSAIVGISSSKLQKLHQGKVANIEAAFAQVCQHKIKVQLEVANPRNTLANNSLVSIDRHDPISHIPERNQNVNHIPSSVNNDQLAQSPAEHTEVIKQKLPTQKQASQTSESNSSSVKSWTSISNLDHDSAPSVSKISALPSLDVSDTENKTIVTPEVIVERDLNQDYTDDNLQQAIDNLTHSFEGELVQLESTQSHFFESSEESEQLDTSRTSTNRPNVEDYDDVW